HIILDLADPVRMQESRDEDVRVRPIKLLVAKIVSRRSDAEPPAFSGVEDGGEYARRVKMRQTEPINRTIHADQSCGPHVADDSVAFNRLVAGRHLAKAVKMIAIP